jgi:hypothetical protein
LGFYVLGFELFVRGGFFNLGLFGFRFLVWSDFRCIYFNALFKVIEISINNLESLVNLVHVLLSFEKFSLTFLSSVTNSL